ncbi:MAG: insulinase family protein, partial [Oscillospiraceae bacterium]|nr:insulinase family protein [Oscillospiraceae bacterium]
MQIGTLIQNFRITSVRRLEELCCNLWELEHEKTGAQLVWLDRADENKTFAIAFKTIPEDATGVFHILEHSVLCGSNKYPVKEPFVELLKSSVNTFLNAMTYPDKTVYPLSSRNNKDFHNLLDVYMDAVLHPAIYYKPEIFRQEGWRYELREGQEPVYQGVVFNEMKGAYASADAVLEHAMNRLLFPDNCYSAESGGHPEHIPDLTYEQFIANHRKFYHPSNSRIILSGSVDLDFALAHIDSYLKDYDRQAADFAIPMQFAVPYREERTIYEIGAEESTANRTIISCGCMLGRFDEQEKLYAAAVLKDYLAGDNDAPLKQAILGTGLGQDVKVKLHDGIQQNWISWEIWNTDENKVDEIKAAVNRVLTELVENGLDK